MTLSQRAVDHERDLFCKMANVGTSRRALDKLQDAYLRSTAVRHVAAHRVGIKRGLAPELVELICQNLNPFVPCNEPINRLKIAKPEGGFRTVNDFGPFRRALDMIQARLLEARFTPHPNLYSIRGRGQPQACARIFTDLQQIGGHFFAVTMDVENAFGSVDGSKIVQSVPVPRAPLRHALSLPSTSISSINLGSGDTAGLPQGSTASNSIMAFVLQPLLTDLPNTALSYLYVDDFLGFADSEGAAVELTNALAAALKKIPGHLKPGSLSISPITEGFDYLGYNFRRRSDGTVKPSISQKSWNRMIAKCDYKARRGSSLDALIQYGDDWQKSFPLALPTEAEKQGFGSWPIEAFWEEHGSAARMLAQAT
jgi:hypothetical protein